MQDTVHGYWYHTLFLTRTDLGQGEGRTRSWLVFTIKLADGQWLLLPGNLHRGGKHLVQGYPRSRRPELCVDRLPRILMKCSFGCSVWGWGRGGLRPWQVPGDAAAAGLWATLEVGGL